MDHVVSRLQDEFGDRLLSVATANFETTTYDVHYIRDDVAEQFPEDRIEDIYHDIGMDAVSRDMSTAYEPIGDHNYTITGYDDAIILVREHAYRVFYVGLEPDPQLLPTAIDVTRELVDEHDLIEK